MILLKNSTGASDFSIVSFSPPSADFGKLKFTAARLLNSRKKEKAAALLETTPFAPYDAINSFHDEFTVLHANLPLSDYERMREELNDPEFSASLRDIAQALEEVGLFVRFIAVDLQLESPTAMPDSSRLTRIEINRLVNRYIGVNGGYLGDFSYRTHHEFYLELELDIDPSNHQGTTRERFIKILHESPAEVQARILDGILRKYPVGSTELRTAERRDEITAWIARLKGISSGSFRGREEDRNNLRPPVHKSLNPDYRFDFGISFAGPDRELARKLRDGLHAARFRVFFDEDYEHEMIGHDGSLYLRNVYSRECRFCVVLISRAYDQRDWTNLEREAVQSRELRGERGILIPVPIEDYQPSWLPETRIRFDLWKRSVPELVNLLAKRLQVVNSTS